MQKDEIAKTKDGWNPENDSELAGILLTISASTRRLANLLLEQKHN